jgi:hypothetical protein
MPGTRLRRFPETDSALSELREIVTEVEAFLARAHASSSSPRHSGRLLGTLLVIRGFLLQSELDYALAQQAATGRRLGEIVVELGLVTEDVVVELVAEQLRIAVFDPKHHVVDVDTARRLAITDARSLGAIPISHTRASILVAVVDPRRADLVADLVRRLHVPVRLCMATGDAIERLIAEVHDPAATVS